MLKHKMISIITASLLIAGTMSPPAAVSPIFPDTAVTASADFSAAPAKVAVKTAYTCTASAVRINWQRVADASGYRVYRYIDGKWTKITTIKNGGTTTFREDGLNAATRYKYKVKAYKKIGGETVWGTASDTKTTVTKPAPFAMGEPECAIDSITLHWTPQTCEGYQIYQQVGDAFEKITTLRDPETGSFEVTGLEPDVSYSFKIRAFAKDGKGKVVYNTCGKLTVNTVADRVPDDDPKPEPEPAPDTDVEPLPPVFINSPSASRTSDGKGITVSWGDNKDASVESYRIMRCAASIDSFGNVTADGDWACIYTAESDRVYDGVRYKYKDTDGMGTAKGLFFYRVDTTAVGGAQGTGKTVLASNLKVCVDPGHFGTINNNYTQEGEGGEYSYSEGKAMIAVGLKLADELERYGIEVYMTRTDDDITLANRTNLDDGVQLEARGTAAKTNSCDFFISLHTNANGYNANDCDTFAQPPEINKTLIFVNNVGRRDQITIDIANTIGRNVTDSNKAFVSETHDFVGKSTTNARTFSSDAEFSAFNESTDESGTVCYRALSSGSDYYAVLRAAAYAGVPGMLVEHAYHTVPGVRQYSNELIEKWARSDAYSIAWGYGFCSSSSKTFNG